MLDISSHGCRVHTIDGTSAVSIINSVFSFLMKVLQLESTKRKDRCQTSAPNHSLQLPKIGKFTLMVSYGEVFLQTLLLGSSGHALHIFALIACD